MLCPQDKKKKRDYVGNSSLRNFTNKKRDTSVFGPAFGHKFSLSLLLPRAMIYNYAVTAFRSRVKGKIFWLKVKGVTFVAFVLDFVTRKLRRR